MEGLEAEQEINFGNLISRQFSHLFNCYAQAFNKMYNRKGTLFRAGLKRKKITHDRYFSALIRYIHNNLVEHDFVKDIADWPHSSYHAFLNNKPTRIAKEEALTWFGGIKGFIDFHSSIEKVFLPELED